MKSKVALSPVDLPLAALARRQHGVVSRDQLLALGLGPTGIAERVRTGRLHRIDEAEYRGRFDLTSLNAVVENNPGRRGDK
jgi:hypothetical protein